MSGPAHYLYNGHNLRAYKSGPTAVVPTGAAYYLYDEQGQLLGEYDANGAPLYETIYLGNMPVGVMKQTGSAATSDIAVTAYNVYSDHIATPRVITQQDQQIVWRWDTAEAFGGSVPEQNPSGLGTFTYNQRFPGQVADAETGLFQNWNREYNARQGRYIQSDPIGLDGGINTFAYVSGNPLGSVDPDGLLGFGGAVGMGGMNASLQIAYLQFGTGGNLVAAARCVDLRKVLINAGFGLVGPTVLGDTAVPRLLNMLGRTRVGKRLPGASTSRDVTPLSASGSTALLAGMVNMSLPGEPVTIGSADECSCVRAEAAKSAPQELRSFLDGLANFGLY